MSRVGQAYWSEKGLEARTSSKDQNWDEEPGVRGKGQSQEASRATAGKKGLGTVQDKGWEQCRIRAGARLGARQAQERSQLWSRALSSQRSVLAVAFRNRLLDFLGQSGTVGNQAAQLCSWLPRDGGGTAANPHNRF